MSDNNSYYAPARGPITEQDKVWAIERMFDDGWSIRMVRENLGRGYNCIQQLFQAERERRGIPAYNWRNTLNMRMMQALAIEGRCPVCVQLYQFDTENGEAIQVCRCGSAYIERRRVG